MNIVIAGGGTIGETLCQELADEANNIVLIEQDEEILERIIQKIDIAGIVGDGADYDNLVEADVENCDFFIAVTEEDEVNIISAIIAKELGATHTVARVRDPKFTKHDTFLRDSLGISILINPELEAAKHISRIIEFPESLSVEPFEHGRVNIVELEVYADSSLANTSLFQFRENYGDVLVCAITHEDDTYIPSGNATILAGDRVFVTGADRDLNDFYRKVGLGNAKVESTMILGGNRLAYYLLNQISQIKMDTKVIESNFERAQELSYQFPSCHIIKGDLGDQDFLTEQKIANYDMVVALSDNDEENIINSIYAMNLGVPKVITNVSRTNLLEIIGKSDLQSVVTPKLLIASQILRFVRSKSSTLVSNVEALHRIADNQVEALQFMVKKDSAVIDVPLRDLKTKDQVLIAYIIRGNSYIFPSGNDSIQVNDHVIVITKHKHFDDIDDILE